MDIGTLTKIIAQAAETSFTRSREKYGSDNIVAYSLLTYDDADSCNSAISTKQALDECNYSFKEGFSFFPAEWDKFDSGTSFNKVNEELCTL